MKIKIIFSIIGLFFIFNKIYSQDYLKFENIDTAITHKNIELQNYSNTGQKINTILELADLQRIKGNYNIALSYLDTLNYNKFNNDFKTKYLDLKGLIYFNLTDIEQAKMLWDNSLKIKDKIFNKDSSIYASTYLYYSMYYMQMMDYSKSFYFSEKSFYYLKNNDNSILYAYICKNTAYTTKIATKKEKTFLINNKYKKLLIKAINYCKKEKYNFYLARLYQDYGNIYTDKIFLIKNQKELIDCYNTAHYYYDLSIKNRKKYIGKNTELNGIVWYVKGLLEKYAHKSKEKEMVFYNNAIKLYYPKYMTNNNYLVDSNITINNKYQILEILGFKISILLELYKEKKDTTYLLDAKNDVYFSIYLWKYILQDFKSFEISKVLSPYNVMPFSNAITTVNELYKLTKNKKYLNDAFQFAEMEKHAIIDRDIISPKLTNLNDKIISLKNTQDKLSDNEAIIEYSERYILLIKKDTFIIKNVGGKYLKQYNYLLQSIQLFKLNEFAKYSFSLYTELIKPINRYLNGVKNITIIPYYKIGLIPFDCLIQNKPDTNNLNYKSLNYMINDFKISYAYSATLKYWKNNKSFNNKIYGISPKFNLDKSLPFSNALLNNLSNKYKGVFNNDTNFFNSANNYSIIHLATHTKLNNEDNNKSLIFLDENSGIEIGQFYKYKLNSQLAVVLACESAIGQIYRGDQTNSFVQAFKYAGVKSVISTLWKVDDKVSNEIIGNFYNNLLEQNQDISSALHNAKKQYLKSAVSDDDYNPYYWSGIIFTGADTKLTIDKTQSYYTLIYGVLVFVIFMGFIIYKYKFKQ